MKLTKRSTAAEVAAAVAQALARAGFRAVLSGGGCAAIYTRGAYQSVDLDFILLTAGTQANLDAAMATVGFERRGDQYFHPQARPYVEFPPGPLSIGRDYEIHPIERDVKGRKILLFSPTDSCRDRLAAFLHWNDQQSLETAIKIAARTDVDLEQIRIWCSKEGVPAGFDEFQRGLTVALRRQARRPKRSRV